MPQRNNNCDFSTSSCLGIENSDSDDTLVLQDDTLEVGIFKYIHLYTNMLVLFITLRGMNESIASKF
jgi:hypothetical protein